MNFEQLLDGATKPANKDNISDIVAARTQLMRRLSPDVMREVWAALKGASSKIHDFEAGKINWNEDFVYRVDRALALLDGQTEDKL